ncbi:Uncharacterized protein GBIM_12207 [Gryllus bimaculatus]|nr:Uncharacterized protein GBIM_12207 [Gryllus bimaculatus]
MFSYSERFMNKMSLNDCTNIRTHMSDVVSLPTPSRHSATAGLGANTSRDPRGSNILCRFAGYLIIVHDVDLNTISEDLAGHFAPFWDFGQSPSLPAAPVCSRSRKRNRLEPVVDFPHAERSSMVTALEVHPQGRSALSLSWSEEKEWVCVHDVQDRAAALPKGSSSAARRKPSKEHCVVAPPFMSNRASVGIVEPTNSPVSKCKP